MHPVIKKTIIGLGTFLSGAGISFASEGVSPRAYHLWEISGVGLPITNSMITSWVVSLILVIAVRIAIGGVPKLVPSKGQAVIEIIAVGIENMIEPIVGKRMVKPTFPLLVGLFTFILINNWSSLIPGVGTFGHYDEHGHLLYYFRPGNADLNLTLALAIVSFVSWIYYIIRYAGFKTIAYDLFGNKADKKEVPQLAYYFLFIIFFGVGIIELISIAFRLVSLSFRLFGNVFGGENLITSITGVFSYLLPVPFYFLEILIGLIQAFVFTLLTAIYIGLICNHGEEEHNH
jgi:F-type H+-transporting ATPase subunit a